MTEFLETRPNELEGLTSESQAADKDDLGNPDARVASLISRLGQRSLVLVGMMGAGKTSIGRRLAARLGLDFVDADAEIEAAAGLTVPEIFARHGETHFRDGERRVIARLLSERQLVLATGGGAYMQKATRDKVAQTGIAIWLKADADVLLRRVRKRSNRPLLETADPEQTLKRLIDERYPIYAMADITVVSRDGPHEAMVEAILDQLESWLSQDHDAPGPTIVPVELAQRSYDIHIGQGLIAQAGRDRHVSQAIWAMFLAEAIIYAFGVTWLKIDMHLTWAMAVEYGFSPFIVADLVKMLIAALMLPAAWHLIDRMGRNK